MAGGVDVAFFGDTMVEVGVVVGMICPTVRVVEAVTDIALDVLFGVAGDAGVITMLLC